MEILTLEEVKDYLRIEQDHIIDDNFLRVLIDGAEGYLKTHVGDDIFNALLTDNRNISKAKIYCLALIGEWYDNRSLEDISEGIKSVVSMLGTQLKYGVVVPIV